MIPNDLDIITKARTLNYASPFFYTSQDILRHNYNTFTDLFSNGDVYYALKANSDPRILTFLKELGCGFEAASSYEIDMLLKVGVDPAKIIYGTSVKPMKHIEFAADNGINRFAADSIEEIDKIAQAAPGVKVFIRTIVEDSGSVFTMSERFGAPVETVKDLVLHVRHCGLKTYGISFYVGSQAASADRWAQGINRIRPVVEELLKEGVMLETINIGGGFPVAYDNHKDAPTLHEIVAKLNNALHLLPYVPKIIMEPGRALVASSTVLVSEVISRSVRGDKVWLGMDAGIYNALYEAMIHQGLTQYAVHPYADVPGTPRIAVTIAGPTGDSLDIITRHVEVPEFIGVGDRLIFENAGAYTVVMANPFNGFPVPPLYIS